MVDPQRYRYLLLHLRVSLLLRGKVLPENQGSVTRSHSPDQSSLVKLNQSVCRAFSCSEDSLSTVCVCVCVSVCVSPSVQQLTAFWVTWTLQRKTCCVSHIHVEMNSCDSQPPKGPFTCCCPHIVVEKDLYNQVKEKTWIQSPQ